MKNLMCPSCGSTNLRPPCPAALEDGDWRCTCAICGTRTEREVAAAEYAHRYRFQPKVHTVRGQPIGPEGSPYGVTHDMDCPGCADTPFTASPRSETYWSS